MYCREECSHSIILPSRWWDFAESLGMERTSCFSLRTFKVLRGRIKKEWMHNVVVVVVVGLFWQIFKRRDGRSLMLKVISSKLDWTDKMKNVRLMNFEIVDRGAQPLWRPLTAWPLWGSEVSGPLAQPTTLSNLFWKLIKFRFNTPWWLIAQSDYIGR